MHRHSLRHVLWELGFEPQTLQFVYCLVILNWRKIPSLRRWIYNFQAIIIQEVQNDTVSSKPVSVTHMVLVAVRVNNNFLADKPGTYANVCPQTTIMQTWLGALTHQLWVKTCKHQLVCNCETEVASSDKTTL